jgi:PD-(D/E)XK nuclease family transposase
MFSSSINSGDLYKELPQTIVISILNYPLFPSETGRFHTVFHIREDEEGFLWSDRLEFHAIDQLFGASSGLSACFSVVFFDAKKLSLPIG